jgi:hypothetical protein
VNERVDKELSAATRQLIADARGVDDPSAEDEARVKARWLATIAAGAGVTSLTEAARAAAGTSWGLKIAGVAAAVAAAGTGLYLGWSTPNGSGDASRPAKVVAAVHRNEEPVAAPIVVAPLPAEKRAPTVEVQAVPAPPAQPEAQAVQADAVVAAAPRAPAATPPRAVAAKAHTAPPERGRVLSFDDEDSDDATTTAEPVSAVGGQLGEEIALLSRIRASVQAGAPSKALELLGDYQRRFARPNLAMEADALHVDALCEAGQRDSAREQAAQFVTNWPGSPLEQRVRAACPAVASP